MSINNFAIKSFSRLREGLASWDSVWRFLRSLEENDDLDFYQGLDERAIRFEDFAGYSTPFARPGDRTDR